MPYLYFTIVHALVSRISGCARTDALMNSASSFKLSLTHMYLQWKVKTLLLDPTLCHSVSGRSSLPKAVS